MNLAYRSDMTQVLIGLGIWFAAALVVGVAVGKLIAAADLAAGVDRPAHAPDAHRAA